MNKIISTLKDLLPLGMLVFALVLIFVPLPVMVIQVLIVLNIGFSLCLFLSKFFGQTSIAYNFPRLVLLFCVLTCALIIATTRTFLTIPTLEGHIPLVLIIGQWICRENFICGFFTTLMLCGSLLLFCKMHVHRSQEVAARFYLDRMNQKMFDIDQQVARKEITEDESEFQKKRVQEKVDHYSCMDGSAKFLLGTLAAFTVLYVVAVGGGVAVGILDRNMHWKDALNQYVMVSSGYLVLFVVPMFLTSLGFKTKLGD